MGSLAPNYSNHQTAGDNIFINLIFYILLLCTHCKYGRNFSVKCGGDSLVWNQYSHWVDAEVTFCIYRFQNFFLEVFWEHH